MDNSQAITILRTCFWVCLVLAILFFVISVILFFLFDIKTIFNIKTGRAKAKTVKAMKAVNDSTGRLRVDGKTQTTKLSKKDIAKGRAPAVTPPSEDVKKQFYQNDDAYQNAPVQQPAPSNTVTEPQNDQYSQQDDVSDGTEVLYAETSVLSNKTDDIKPVEFDPNEPSIPIRIIKEIMVVHTDEVIPLT